MTSLQGKCAVLRSLQKTLFHSAVCICKYSNIDTASRLRVTKYVFTANKANIRLLSTVQSLTIANGLMAKVMLVRAGQTGITLAEPVMTCPAMLHTGLVKMKTKYEVVEGECVFIDCIDRLYRSIVSIDCASAPVAPGFSCLLTYMCHLGICTST